MCIPNARDSPSHPCIFIIIISITSNPSVQAIPNSIEDAAFELLCTCSSCYLNCSNRRLGKANQAKRNN